MGLRLELFQESKYIKLYKHGCNLLFMSDYSFIIYAKLY